MKNTGRKVIVNVTGVINKYKNSSIQVKAALWFTACSILQREYPKVCVNLQTDVR